MAEYGRKRRAAQTDEDREFHRLRTRRYREENPHLTFHTTSRYLARKADVFSDLTKEDAYDIYHSVDECAYCGKVISRDNSREIHIDHVIPMRQGGPNSRWNLVKTCNSCNSSKNYDSLITFRSRTPEFSEERFAAVVFGMVAQSGLAETDVHALLTQSYEFEIAFERERAKLTALLSRKIAVKLAS